MKIRYFLITAVLATAILCSAGVVNATDNSALIAQLQAQIANLMAQLQALQAQQSTTTWCHTFNTNLNIYNNNSEVAELETALQKSGINVPSFPNYQASEYFNAATYMNVKEFQKKYGIIQTGYVGPLTRAKLNSLYGCGITTQNITINSVSGPTSISVGQTGTWVVNAIAPAISSNSNLTYSVDWGDNYYPTTGANTVSTPNQTSSFTHAYNQAGTYTVRFTVDNGVVCIMALCTARKTVETSMTVVVGGGISQNLSITYPADPAGWQGYVGGYVSSKYFNVANFNSSRHYTWSVSSGSLPSGLTLDVSSSVCLATANSNSTLPPSGCIDGSRQAVISGYPTQAGSFPFTLTVRDDLGNTGSLNLNINIENNNWPVPLKPVIYLYPQKTEAVKVQLDYAGKLIADYPAYDKKIGGWEVTASPDGKIINKADGQEYSYLFWEGNDYNQTNYDLSTGFVVKGSDSRAFLQRTLSKMGLTPKEYNEFIVYWYPKMENNAYNLIYFAGKEYTDKAKLTISPTPDSVLRVFMAFKPIDQEIKVAPQEIKSFVRKGFAVVEWGGTELNK